MMNGEIYVRLLEVKTYALERKAELLKGGRAIAEPNIPPQPVAEDFIEGDAEVVEVVEPLKLTMPEEPPKLEGRTLKDLETVQINVDEVLNSPPPKEHESIKSAADEKKDQEQPLSANIESNSPSPFKKEKISKPKLRFLSFLAALSEWRVQKWRAEYEYSRTKKEVLDSIYGYDDIIRYIDKELAKIKEENSQTL